MSQTQNQGESQVRNFVVSRGGVSLVPAPRPRFCRIHLNSPFCAFGFSLFDISNFISLQCDEAHPVCRNCVKSKRECLGYDPVFRTQASTPSAIQPAPNPPPSLVVNPQGPSTIPTTPSYPSAPPGYMPASSQPFAPSLHSESPSASTDHHEHGATLDPSLDQTNHTDMQNTVQRPQGETPYKGELNKAVTVGSMCANGSF
jgi:hypothetical protein